MEKQKLRNIQLPPPWKLESYAPLEDPTTSRLLWDGSPLTVVDPNASTPTIRAMELAHLHPPRHVRLSRLFFLDGVVCVCVCVCAMM